MTLLAQLDGGARLGGQPRPCAVGARHGGGSLQRAGTPKSWRRAVSCSAAAVTASFASPRGWAFCAARHQRVPARVSGRQQRRSAADAALGAAARRCSRRTASADWPWCEDTVTYDNARLPQALIVSGERGLGNAEMTAPVCDRSIGSPRFSAPKRVTSQPIGSNGFYAQIEREGASSISSRSRPAPWSRLASTPGASPATSAGRARCAARFAGSSVRTSSSLRSTIPRPAAVATAFIADRPNENQGAESTLSFLLALTEMGILDSEIRLRDEGPPTALRARVWCRGQRDALGRGRRTTASGGARTDLVAGAASSLRTVGTVRVAA